MNEYIQTMPQELKVRRKKSDACGKMLITFMVLNIALTAVLGFFAPEALVCALCPCAGFVITFLIVFNRDFAKLLSGKFGTEKSIRPKIMSGMADYMFAVFAVTVCLGIVAAVVDLTGIDIFSENIRVSVPIQGFGGVVYGVYICLVAPVMHELIFRGAVMKSFEDKGENTAVLVSALLYSLLHGVYITSIYAFVAGIVLGKISLKAKSLATVIKINLLCSWLIYAIMLAVSADIKLLYIPLFIVFGFFALMGLCRALLKRLERKKNSPAPADFGTLLKLPVAGAALLMIAEDILFLLRG